MSEPLPPKTLPPIDKFELNRMVHARAQELWLPGSRPGTSGHKHLSMAAKIHFGKTSWADLNVDEMRKVYEFLDSQKRLPKKGEI